MAESELSISITLKTIGPSLPSLLRIPSPLKVSDLRTLISADRRLPLDRLKLVWRGRMLEDTNGVGDSSIVRIEDGDSLIVAVAPKPPAKHLQEEDDEEETLQFQIPESTSWWKRRFIFFLREKLRLPDVLLMAIFSISLKVWACIFLWFSLAPIAHRWDLGPLYILGTGFLIILVNLGKRQHGDVSAYSIFNEDFRELPGTLNADRLDRDIRVGQF